MSGITAREMVDKDDGATNCLSLLSQSKEALKIQDLLPLLPEFTKMGHLKDPLVECLKEHSAKIEVSERVQMMKRVLSLFHMISLLFTETTR